MTLDMKANSLLLAPPSPPGFPSLPSPFTGLRHRLRIIDFELARKTDYKLQHMIGGINDFLHHVVEDDYVVEDGYVN
jgi:hypothetical protein